MRFTEDSERFNDIDYVEPDDAPICVCPEYIGSKHVAYCKSCMDWTDNIEIAKMEAAEQMAAIAVAAPAKPAAIATERNAHVAEPFRSILNSYSYASIGNGLYCRVAAPKKSRKRRGF